MFNEADMIALKEAVKHLNGPHPKVTSEELAEALDKAGVISLVHDGTRVLHAAREAFREQSRRNVGGEGCALAEKSFPAPVERGSDSPGQSATETGTPHPTATGEDRG